MRMLVAMRLSSFRDGPDKNTDRRSRVMWEEASRRGIRIQEFRLFGIGRGIFLATYQGRHKAFLDLPRPGEVTSKGLLWMDDKEILRKKLRAAGVPTPRGGAATTIKEALALFKRISPPVITKPEIGSRSRHTRTHIHTTDELVQGFKKAKVLSPWVIVEEEEVGFVYRGTVVGGKLVAVLRREPPMVIGDGVRTVAELVENENKNPRRDGDIFHIIGIDDEAHVELGRQELALESVPEKGRIVTFSQKASRGIGGGTTDMTDSIHADNRVMLEAAAALVDDPLIGIDFIISDVATSWKVQERSGIIECNSMPFIDLHHYPLAGSPRNVAGALWEIVFPTAPLT
ncbi:hypothetical protein EXS57_03270 [Candidatus Kaiserbacteria bacterium]|nr:hypothetical protein [Candidatus Kaiserbacteria bacterium]